MKKYLLNRRRFLKSSAIAAATPLFFSRNVFAKDSVAPNSIINLGIIGIGKMAVSHVNAFSNDPRCRIRAVADVDDERLKYQLQNIPDRYRKLYNEEVAVKGYKDFREMLADPSIDGVIVVTPDHWHAINAILAARAGKAVYCEKPMTFTIEEGQQIVDAVRETGVVFQTGSQQRSDSGFRRAVQLARSGRLGEIKEVWCNFGRRFPTVLNWQEDPLPAGVDWDMWIGPAPMRPYSTHMLSPLMGGEPYRPYGNPWGEWRWHLEYGNGLQADWGAHHIDIAQWGLGMDGKGPKYIEVFEDQNPKMPSDTKNIFYTYSNGAKLRLGFPDHLRQDAYGATNIAFIGTEGVATAARNGKFWADKPSLRNARVSETESQVFVSDNHRKNFIDAMLTGAPTICPPEIGQSSCNACLVGNIAHLVGRNLEWDWQKQQFVNDDIANRYLRREKRAPWNLI